MLIRVQITVSGQVQGVGFRYATVTEARRLGLGGWARNRPDGSVEVVADGEADAVRALITWCRTGPPMARVQHVTHDQIGRDAPLGEFSVRW